MLNAQQIKQIGELIASAHKQQCQLEQPIADLSPADFTDSYAIQDAVMQGLGWSGENRVTCWKTGAQSPESTTFIAPVPPTGVYANDAQIDAGQFHSIGAEAELAYRLGRDLPARDSPYTEDEVRQAIDALVVTIEICDSRLGDWRNSSFYWQSADNQNSAALIIGDLLIDWQSVDMSVQPAELLVNGEVVVSTVAGNTFTDPSVLMVDAVNQSIARVGGLKAGDLFTAGSWTGTTAVQMGSEVIARFPGIGQARAWFK